MVARHIIERGIALDRLRIDVSGLAPEDLISSFVNGFLHQLEEAGRSVEDASAIEWRASFPSESTRLSQLVTYYLQDARSRTSPGA